MKPIKACSAIIIISFVLMACNTQPSTNLSIKDSLQYSPDSNYGIIMKDKEDTAFIRLMHEAQNALPTFIDSLKQQSKNPGYRFTVKSAFSQNNDTEHMWTEVHAYDGTKFSGLFTDSAYVLTNIKTGDKVSIKKELVEDWIIFDNVHDRQYGYFSKEFLHDQ